MGEKRSIGGHADHIGISLESGHERRFEKRGVEVIPLFVLAMAGILAGEDFRTFTVVIVVALSLAEAGRSARRPYRL